MPTLWFCVPAHGRVELAAICLRQLRRTCNELTRIGIEASAVIVANDRNLDTARNLGFATVRRNNKFLSQKFNDGIQFACDPEYNPRPVDFVVPCGSDDWIDHRILRHLPHPHQIIAFRHMSFVREDGDEIMDAHIRYRGGSGIRVYPRGMLEPLGYRPADEDRHRACDTSILTNIDRVWQHRPPTVLYRDLHVRQIVDWKSAETQINPYGNVAQWRRGTSHDPFVELAQFYPADAIDEMRRHYRHARRCVPA